MTTFPPTTNTKPNNPKIKICLSGLGIMVLNEQAQAQIGYLPVHPTLISIWRNNQVIMLDCPMDGNDLEILSPDGEGKCECYIASGQDDSYENMIDLSEIYGGSAELDSTKSFPERIIIDDAVFFTEPTSLINVIKYEEGQTQSDQPLNGVGTGLWAYSKNPNASFRYKEVDYEPGEGETYTIRILSDCLSDESDFKHYYDYLTNAGNTVYNLREPDENPNALWFTDMENRTLRAFLNEFGSALPHLFDPSNEKIDRKSLINKLKWIAVKKCAPEPCLKVTFTNKARTLPGS